MAICRDDFIKGSRFILISILGGTVLTYFACPGCSNSLARYSIVSLLNSLCWFFMWGGHSLFGRLMDGQISWRDSPVRRLLVSMVFTITYTIVVMIMLLESFGYFFNFNFGEGYSQSIYISIAITIFISLFLHGRGFLMSWREAAGDAERLQKESAIAKYESLKNQVNPHFLFNSLNALTNLVYEDQNKAVKFIKQLSEVYRYVLDTRDQEVVSLRDELEFLRSYLFLQQIRFGENLKININVKEEGMVAPLALQMLIEMPLSIILFLQKIRYRSTFEMKMDI